MNPQPPSQVYPTPQILNPNPFTAPEQFEEMSRKLAKKVKDLTASASNPTQPAETTIATKPVSAKV